MKKVGNENRLRGTSKDQRTCKELEMDKNTSARAETFTLKHTPGSKPKVNRGLGRQTEAHYRQNQSDG